MRVTSILINKGPGVSVAGDHGVAALHASPLNWVELGHVAVTKILVKAGADWKQRDLSAEATHNASLGEGGVLRDDKSIVKGRR